MVHHLLEHTGLRQSFGPLATDANVPLMRPLAAVLGVRRLSEVLAVDRLACLLEDRGVELREQFEGSFGLDVRGFVLDVDTFDLAKLRFPGQIHGLASLPVAHTREARADVERRLCLTRPTAHDIPLVEAFGVDPVVRVGREA